MEEGPALHAGGTQDDVIYCSAVNVLNTWILNFILLLADVKQKCSPSELASF